MITIKLFIVINTGYLKSKIECRRLPYVHPTFGTCIQFGPRTPEIGPEGGSL